MLCLSLGFSVINVLQETRLISFCVNDALFTIDVAPVGLIEFRGQVEDAAAVEVIGKLK